MSEEELQWCAGMIDGDGCILIHHNPSKPYGGLYVKVSQSTSADGVPEELSVIQKLLGGSILERPRNPATKRAWNLNISCGGTNRAVIDLLDERSIVKYDQVQVVLEYLRGGRADPQKYIKILRSLRDGNGLSVPKGRVTRAYVAGLVSANGCVVMREDGTPTVEISLPRCMPALETIRRRYGGKIYRTGCLFWSGKEAMKILAKIRKHVIGPKRKQMDVIKQFRARYPIGRVGERRSQEEIKEAKAASAKVKELKK